MRFKVKRPFGFQRWLHEFKAWITKLRSVAITVAVVIIVLVITRCLTENWILYAGLKLQFVGTLCILPPLYSRLIRGKQGGISQIIVDWVKSYPKPYRRISSEDNFGIVFSGQVADAGASTETPVILSYSSLGERVEALEKYLESQMTEILAANRQLSSDIDSIVEDLNKQNNDFEGELTRIEGALEESQTKGLMWDIMGVIWLLFGLAFTAIATV